MLSTPHCNNDIRPLQPLSVRDQATESFYTRKLQTALRTAEICSPDTELRTACMRAWMGLVRQLQGDNASAAHHSSLVLSAAHVP